MKIEDLVEVCSLAAALGESYDDAYLIIYDIKNIKNYETTGNDDN